MMRPPNQAQAESRGLVAKYGEGIHTFSNGTQWECWASGNCLRCKWYGDEGGADCAFELSAIAHLVSPQMAELFGWTRHEKYPESFVEPESCRFFRDKDDNSGGHDTPPHDPAQLVLIADPTEPIYGLVPETADERINA